MSVATFLTFLIALLSSVSLFGADDQQSVNAPIPEGCFASDLEVDPDRQLRVLFEMDDDIIRSHVLFYEEPCDGGLYLFNYGHRFRLGESWRFYRFGSADWTNESHDKIAVSAEFVTGIGPEGAQPFQADYRLERKGMAWHEVSVTFPSREDIEESVYGQPLKVPSLTQERRIYNVAHPGAASSLSELRALNHSWKASFPVDAVDFESQRVAAGLFFLTSGSMTLKGVRVYRSDDGYTISYSLHQPRIGTTDIKRSALYVLLPRDDLPFTFVERGKGLAAGRSRGKVVDVPVRIANRLVPEARE